MINKSLFFLILLCLQSNAGQAKSNKDKIWYDLRSEGLDPGKTYDISSGTGFFISKDYIVTNQHVVDKCINISIRGAVRPSTAHLISYDRKNDLALLKSTTSSSKIAYITPEFDLEANDDIYVIGYPLSHSQTGEYKFLHGKTIKPLDQSNLNKIEFSSTIEKGNSGGPLINANGSIVGVVQAKKSYYLVETDRFGKKKTSNKPHKINGIAINSNDLKHFLNLSGAKYRKGYVSANELHKNQIRNVAEQFTVNIHCVRNFEHSLSFKNEDVSHNNHQKLSISKKITKLPK